MGRDRVGVVAEDHVLRLVVGQHLDPELPLQASQSHLLQVVGLDLDLDVPLRLAEYPVHGELLAVERAEPLVVLEADQPLAGLDQVRVPEHLADVGVDAVAGLVEPADDLHVGPDVVPEVPMTRQGQSPSRVRPIGRVTPLAESGGQPDDRVVRGLSVDGLKPQVRGFHQVRRLAHGLKLAVIPDRQDWQVEALEVFQKELVDHGGFIDNDRPHVLQVIPLSVADLLLRVLERQVNQAVESRGLDALLSKDVGRLAAQGPDRDVMPSADQVRDQCRLARAGVAPDREYLPVAVGIALPPAADFVDDAFLFGGEVEVSHLLAPS